MSKTNNNALTDTQKHTLDSIHEYAMSVFALSNALSKDVPEQLHDHLSQFIDFLEMETAKLQFPHVGKDSGIELIPDHKTLAA